MGWDKRKAEVGKRRIKEKTLFLISIIFGAVGIYAGMRVFRHKTQKKSFVYGVPLIIIIQVVIVIGILAVTLELL